MSKNKVPSRAPPSSGERLLDRWHPIEEKKDVVSGVTSRDPLGAIIFGFPGIEVRHTEEAEESFVARLKDGGYILESVDRVYQIRRVLDTDPLVSIIETRITYEDGLYLVMSEVGQPVFRLGWSPYYMVRCREEDLPPILAQAEEFNRLFWTQEPSGYDPRNPALKRMYLLEQILNIDIILSSSWSLIGFTSTGRAGLERRRLALHDDLNSITE